MSDTRRAIQRAAAIVADYLDTVEQYPVFPRIAPGAVRAAIPSDPPQTGEPLDALLDDYRRIVEPNVTHWNHPGFLAYVPTSATAPGIVGEMLAAGINAQAMLWRTGPAPTELEELVCDWLRGMLGLPPEFRGHINDTASTSSMLALAAARDRALPGVREHGIAGVSAGPLVVYASEHAHSSIDKAAITLGLGLHAVRRVAADAAFAMRPEALDEAITAGHLPRPSIPWPGSKRSRAATASGCTSTPRTPDRRRSARSFAGTFRAGSSPIRSSSTRTNGCSRRWTARCCCCGTRTR
jgi:aromatic-L-amino-acid decarboxylase